MRTLLLCTRAALLLFGMIANGQTCSVDGTVVSSVTGTAIVRAHVVVLGDGTSAPVDSDVNGKWRLEHLDCGPLTLVATRPGFLKLQTELALKPGTPVHDLSLKLSPQAVIAGRVLDDQGDPIAGAGVSLLTSRIVNGVRGLQRATSTQSDDRGEYRFAGLAAGKYLVCVTGLGGYGALPMGTPLYGERCYPGSADAGPEGAMDVAAGYDGKFDFTLTPVATVTISGTVSGFPDGSRNTLLLSPITPGLQTAGEISAGTRPDGSFTIRNVPPGSYLLSARNSSSAGITAHSPVNVKNHDIESIRMNLESGVRVTATVKVVSATGRKVGQRYTISLKSADLAIYPAQWDDARTNFVMTGVHPDEYRLEAVPPAPFYLKSVMMDGREIAGASIVVGSGGGSVEIVLSDDGGSVEGEVSDSDTPQTGWVYLERDGSASRNVRADAKGHFKIDTLQPGDYKIYAWDDNTKVEYANPDWMRRNGKAVAVTVAPGQTAQVKVIRQIAPPE